MMAASGRLSERGSWNRNPEAKGWQRGALFLFGLLNLALAGGLFLQTGWAIQAWPWPDGRLSYIFVASIFAAIAAALLWIAVTGELRPLAAGALNLMVTLGGMTVYLLSLALQGGRPEVLGYAVATGAGFLVSVVAFLWARRVPVRDPRPTPTPVLVSFLLFALVLIAASVALFSRQEAIFPWPLNPDTSVLFGWIFLGDAFYFLYGLVHRRWHNAAPQLWSFLAYDLLLLGPLLGHLDAVAAEHRPSLLVYIGVLVFSLLVAVAYLIANPETRAWGAHK
jgi:hypothetical protein